MHKKGLIFVMDCCKASAASNHVAVETTQDENPYKLWENNEENNETGHEHF